MSIESTVCNILPLCTVTLENGTKNISLSGTNKTNVKDSSLESSSMNWKKVFLSTSLQTSSLGKKKQTKSKPIVSNICCTSSSSSGIKQLSKEKRKVKTPDCMYTQPEKRKRIVLTSVEKLEICKLYKGHTPKKEIIQKYKVGKSTLCDIIKKEQIWNNRVKASQLGKTRSKSKDTLIFLHKLVEEAGNETNVKDLILSSESKLNLNNDNKNDDLKICLKNHEDKNMDLTENRSLCSKNIDNKNTNCQSIQDDTVEISLPVPSSNNKSYSKRKRIVLSIDEKLEICEMKRNNIPAKTIIERFGVGRTTINDICRKENILKSFHEAFLSGEVERPAKIMKTGTFFKLDVALYRWLQDQKKSEGKLTRQVFLNKASQLHQSLYPNHPKTFKASNGFLWRFCKRFGIKNMFSLENKSNEVDVGELDKNNYTLSLADNTANQAEMFDLARTLHNTQTNKSKNKLLKKDQEEIANVPHTNLRSSPLQPVSLKSEKLVSNIELHNEVEKELSLADSQAKMCEDHSSISFPRYEVQQPKPSISHGQVARMLQHCLNWTYFQSDINIDDVSSLIHLRVLAERKEKQEATNSSV